ncbi:hypothetical protein [Enterobacter cloacae]
MHFLEQLVVYSAALTCIIARERCL